MAHLAKHGQFSLGRTWKCNFTLLFLQFIGNDRTLWLLLTIPLWQLQLSLWVGIKITNCPCVSLGTAILVEQSKSWLICPSQKEELPLGVSGAACLSWCKECVMECAIWNCCSREAAPGPTPNWRICCATLYSHLLDLHCESYDKPFWSRIWPEY